jgi:lipoprotein-anchoring transpeptidase ErfK/SrfK
VRGRGREVLHVTILLLAIQRCLCFEAHMKTRRHFLKAILGAGFVAATTSQAAAQRSFFDFLKDGQKKRQVGHALKHVKRLALGKHKISARHTARPVYQGAAIVDYASLEKPGTIIIKTQERALYQVLGPGKAKRFLVAVGKEGFSWSGVAKIGMKRENPMWTPPPEMIARKPEYAKWAAGMPGGLPSNPLGPRAMYLFNKGDTGFRIHGTIHPESIGHAASSGCIRMLNNEVIDLYAVTKVGTKVIVI